MFLLEVAKLIEGPGLYSAAELGEHYSRVTAAAFMLGYKSSSDSFTEADAWRIAAFIDNGMQEDN